MIQTSVIIRSVSNNKLSFKSASPGQKALEESHTIRFLNRNPLKLIASLDYSITDWGCIFRIRWAINSVAFFTTRIARLSMRLLRVSKAAPASSGSSQGMQMPRFMKIWLSKRDKREWDKEILVQKKMLDSRIDRSNLSSSHCFILHFSLGTQLSPPQNCVVLFGVHINGFLWHYKGRNRPIMRHTIQLRVYLKYWCTNHLFDTITEELVMFCSFENIGKGNPTTFQHFLQVVLSIIHSYSTVLPERFNQVIIILQWIQKHIWVW